MGRRNVLSNEFPIIKFGDKMVKKDADLSAGKLRTRAQPGSSSKSKEG